SAAAIPPARLSKPAPRVSQRRHLAYLVGWLALGLARADRPAPLARLQALVGERVTSLETFAFDEYLHGATGTPGGVTQMAYSATGLVFLEVAGSEAQKRLFGA